MDMTKVIVTALYNLPELVTEKNKVAWKHAERLSRTKKENLQRDYDLAYRILSRRAN